MKIRIVCLLLLISSSVLAQQEEKKRLPFTLNSIQVAVGFSVDQLRDINKDFMGSTTLEPEKLEMNVDGLRPTFGTRAVASSFFTNVFFGHREFNNSSFLNRSELSIGMGFHSSRELRAG